MKLHARLALALAFVAALVVWLAPRSAAAMPMFARKYKMDCSQCHDAPALPRLNATGFKFRRAGFRMPDQIGQDELADYDAANYFSAQLAVEYGVTHTNQPAEGASETQGSFAFDGASLYPITGSFMKHWATETELALAPDEAVEIENAYLRGVWGGETAWLELRAGLFHAIEGFGASDRPLGLSAPLFMSASAFGYQDALFRLVEPSRLGAEAGVQWKNASLTVQALNALTTVVRSGGLDVTGAAPVNRTRTDFAVSFNQILGEHAGVGAYWIHGATRLPFDEAGFVAGTNPGTWGNAFDRFAAFASFGIGRFIALAGGGFGFDHALDPATGDKTRFTSGGGFVEADYGVFSDGAVFVRLDGYDPSTLTTGRLQRALTAGAVLHDQWIYVTPEARWFVANDDVAATRRDLSFITRLAVIY